MNAFDTSCAHPGLKAVNLIQPGSIKILSEEKLV